jgi:hypothetical protein
MILLKSLVYFEDIKDEKLILFNKDLDFEKVKSYLVQEVKKYESKFF